MPTDTIYSTAAADGAVFYTGAVSGTWAAARAGTGGSATAQPSTANATCTIADYNNAVASGYRCGRGFLVFDTSTIPDAATITAATLNLYVTDNNHDSNGGVTVVESTQASTSNLTTSDYGAFNTTEFVTRASALGGSATNYANFTVSAYNALTLNASGLAAISKTGFTKLAVLSTFDVDNSAPGVTGVSRLIIYYSDQTGTSNDPYLSVTYTVPGAVSPQRRRPSGLYIR